MAWLRSQNFNVKSRTRVFHKDQPFLRLNFTFCLFKWCKIVEDGFKMVIKNPLPKQKRASNCQGSVKKLYGKTFATGAGAAGVGVVKMETLAI